MNVASLELCKELYELSGWFDTYAKYYLLDGFRSIRPSIKVGDDYPGHVLVMETPAYDLGYLLRKLPMFQKYGTKNSVGETTNHRGRLTITFADNGQRVATYTNVYTYEWLEPYYADTPEDAACKLCIELFKQEILHKEPNTHE